MNSEQLFVSVIVPAYNSAKTLPITLHSLKNQTYPQQLYEVIVVNDGSQDDTPAVLEKLSLPTNFSVIHHLYNQGLAQARNSGIRAAKGDLLIFLDADMEVETNFIERHVTRQREPGVVGVVSACLPAPLMKMDKYQKYLYFSRRGARRFKPEQPLSYQVFIMGLTSVKRAALEAVGLFNSEIKTYGGEDTELAYRLWRQYPTGLFYEPHIEVYHHHFRPFTTALELVTRFATEVVPIIVKRHPELVRLYHFDYLPQIKSNYLLKRILGKLLLTPGVEQIAHLLYTLSPYPISNAWVRFLLATALLKGIKLSYENHPTENCP